ncbi:MAG: hypothetical protein ACXVLM_18470 [Ilumatobacteraceae bacterium]
MIKTALAEKLAHGQRSRGASPAEHAMEFFDLLDEIAPEQVAVSAKSEAHVKAFAAPAFADPLPPPAVHAETDLSLADLVMFPVPQLFVADPEPMVPLVEDAGDETIEEIVAAPAKISRFAASGIDDDLLPVRAARRRVRR